MARRYSPEYKKLALHCLDSNHGDVALTSTEIGVPGRTLRRWRQQRRQRQIDMPEPKPEIEVPVFSEDYEAFQYLRQQLMRHMLAIAASLSEDLENATVAQRAIALSRLIDRFEKLDRYMPPSDEPFLRIEYVEYEPTEEEIEAYIAREAALRDTEHELSVNQEQDGAQFDEPRRDGSLLLPDGHGQ